MRSGIWNHPAGKGKPPMRYRVRRIAPGSLSKFGCVLGALVSLFPSLLLAGCGLLLVGGVHRLLESWQQVEIHLLGQSIPVDVVALLDLESALRTATILDGLSWSVALIAVAIGCAVGGVVFLVFGNLAGWLYNLVAALSGGLEVELEEGRSHPRRER
jgi:hypothetical protein